MNPPLLNLVPPAAFEKVGFWGLPTGAGCAPCGCDPIGAHNSSCHEAVGQCYCKQGVGGTRCDTCLAGYYGFSSSGCQGIGRETTRRRRTGIEIPLFCSLRPVRTSGPHLRPRHRSLRVPDPHLRRALRPLQARLLGLGGGGWVQAVRLHPRLHEAPLRPPGTMPLQNRLRRAQVREMRERVLRLPQVSTLRLQRGRHHAVRSRDLRLQRPGTVSL